jgi:hypothetical protein
VHPEPALLDGVAQIRPELRWLPLNSVRKGQLTSSMKIRSSCVGLMPAASQFQTLHRASARPLDVTGPHLGIIGTKGQ